MLLVLLLVELLLVGLLLLLQLHLGAKQLLLGEKSLVDVGQIRQVARAARTRLLLLEALGRRARHGDRARTRRVRPGGPATRGGGGELLAGHASRRRLFRRHFAPGRPLGTRALAVRSGRLRGRLLVRLHSGAQLQVNGCCCCLSELLVGFCMKEASYRDW